MDPVPAAGPATVSVTVDGNRAGPAAYRSMMSSFPSGVSVVTSVAADGSPRGFTCSALCSVSADPPTLLICVNNRSGTLAAMLDHGLFAVNLLRGGSMSTARAFASGRPDRFAGIDWVPMPGHRLPHLRSDAHTVAECRVVGSHCAGDHTIVLGEVLGVTVAGGPPLLYGLREFRTWPV